MMEPIQLKPDEHLGLVLKNPNSLIAKERALSESTYPLLTAYYEWLRHINAIKNKLDITIQNERIISEFVFLCKYNLLFFLTVTGQFNIIRELYTDNKLAAKTRYLLGSIQQEYEKAHQQQAVSPLKISGQSAKTEDTSPLAAWMIYAKSISNMDLYLFYSQEVNRVTYAHHTQQTLVLTNAFDSRIDRISQILGILETDTQISEEVKREAKEMFDRFKQAKQLISSAKNHDAPLDQDNKTAKQLYLSMQKLYDESDELSKFLEKHCRNQPQLKAILKQDKKDTLATKERLKENEREYKKQIAVLVAHKESVRKGACNDIEKNIHHIIHFINNCPKDKLNAEQKIALNKATERLKEYKTKFKHCTDFDTMQTMLKECTVELNAIEQLLIPSLPQHAIKLFTREIELFKRGIIELRHTPTNLFKEDEALKEGNSKQEILDTVEKIIPKDKNNQNLKNLKLEIQSLRDNQQPIELPPQDQEDYKFRVNGSIEKIKELIQEGYFAPEDKMHLDGILSALQQIKAIGFEKVHPILIKSLINQALFLDIKYEKLKLSEENFSTFIGYLTEKLQGNDKL